MLKQQTRNYDKTKRHIIPWTKEYHTISNRERRNKTITYFNRWNRYLIRAKDIEENRLFNISDLHYIFQNQIRKSCN